MRVREPWHPQYHQPRRFEGRDRYDLANAYRLLKQLQGALNRLPAKKLGRLADLRDVLEKYHERPVYSKRDIRA